MVPRETTLSKMKQWRDNCGETSRNSGSNENLFAQGLVHATIDNADSLGECGIKSSDLTYSQNTKTTLSTKVRRTRVTVGTFPLETYGFDGKKIGNYLI